MTLATALTRLATWTVTGVTTHYAYNALPDGVIPESKLPALLPLFGGDSLAAPANAGASQVGIQVSVEHLLLIRGAGLGLSTNRLTDYVTLIDNYMAKLVTDFTLNGNLMQPIVVELIQADQVEYAGVLYDAILFRHVWSLLYT